MGDQRNQESHFKKASVVRCLTQEQRLEVRLSITTTSPGISGIFVVLHPLSPASQKQMCKSERGGEPFCLETFLP